MCYNDILLLFRPTKNTLKKDNPIFNKLMVELQKKNIRKDALVIISEYEDLGSLRTWRMEGLNSNSSAQWKSIIFQIPGISTKQADLKKITVIACKIVHLDELENDDNPVIILKKFV